MKKILCCLLLTIAISELSHAQTDKGDWMAGGSFLINTTKRVSEFRFTPNVGHFFINNLAFGGEMVIAFDKDGEIRNTELGAGLFGRFYFNLKEPEFKPFLHSSFNLTSVRSKDTLGTITETSTGFVFGAGGAYFINDNVAIDGLAGYSYRKVENTPGSGGFIFRIGFQVHLLSSQVRRK